MASPSRKVGAKRGVRDIDYHEWIGGGNADKFATREQVVAFSNFDYRTRIVPFVAGVAPRIRDDVLRELHERRLLVRFWRWLTSFGHRPMTREQALKILSEYPRPEDEEKAEQAAAVAEAETEPPEPPQHRSCVLCGSVQLEPINEHGRLRCDRGHIGEEPPLQMVEGERHVVPNPDGSPTSAEPQGEAEVTEIGKDRLTLAAKDPAAHGPVGLG